MFIQKKSDLSAKALSELGMKGCTDGWLYGLKDGRFEAELLALLRLMEG